jgi:hypothetical protein
MLQHYFKVRVAEAKKAIPDLTVDGGGTQRLKLKLSGSKEEQSQQRIMLRMGGRKDSPGISPAPKAGSPAVQSNGSIGAADGTLRQTGENGQVPLTSNGISGLRNPFVSHSGSTPVAYLAHMSKERTGSFSGSAASPTPSTGAMKTEDRTRHSPSAGAVSPRRTGSQGTPQPMYSSNSATMPPPSNTTPKGSTDLYHPQGTPAFVPNSSHIPHHHPPAHPFDSKWRQPGKGEF